jgi:hypothetical protein
LDLDFRLTDRDVSRVSNLDAPVEGGTFQIGVPGQQRVGAAYKAG